MPETTESLPVRFITDSDVVFIEDLTSVDFNRLHLVHSIAEAYALASELGYNVRYVMDKAPASPLVVLR